AMNGMLFGRLSAETAMRESAPVGLPKLSAASAGRNVCGLDFLPLLRFRRTLDGVEHALVLHTVLEVRRGNLAPSDGVEQVVNCVRERVLVADDVTRRPPRADVRMRRVGRQDGSEAAVRAFLFINLQLVHPFEVEDYAPFASVDLEAVVVLAARGEARAF